MLYTEYSRQTFETMKARRVFEAPLIKRIPWGLKYCTFCGRSYIAWIWWGWPSEKNEALQVVGGKMRRHQCPVCRSADRHRLCHVWLLENASALFQSDCRVLHVAPEKLLGAFISAHDKVTYVTGDKRASAHAYPESVLDLDLCDLPFPEDHFKLVIANHVLEHIPDDRKAMAEILRVLQPGGVALLQVPYTVDSDVSIEDDQAGLSGDPELLERVFGQYDHVRIYAWKDYIHRLTETGFSVEPQLAKDMTRDSRLRSSVTREETLFVCRKRG